jgi:hypothetical protein
VPFFYILGPYNIENVYQKCKLVPVLNSWTICHKAVWRSGGIAPPFLTPALDGGEWWASPSCRFTPLDKDSATHWIGGWLGPRAGLDAVEKRKILHCRESNPGCPTDSPSLYRLSYPDSAENGGTLTHYIKFVIHMVASMKIIICWNAMPCNAEEFHRRFGGTWWLQLEGRIVS